MKPATAAQTETLQRLTQAAGATILGVAPRTLRDWRDAPRNKDGSYNASELVAWRIASLLAEQAARLTDGDAEVMTGPSSPALERLRVAKAEEAELNLAQRRGQLAPVDVAWTVLEVAASRIRNAGDVLARKYGDDARQILDDALNDADRAFSEGGDADA